MGGREDGEGWSRCVGDGHEHLAASWTVAGDSGRSRKENEKEGMKVRENLVCKKRGASMHIIY